MTNENLQEVLAKHAKYLRFENDGECANLRGADLRGADLRGADLRGADLSDANLRGADLTGADLSDANLRGADLSDANLRGADLRYADLRYAKLVIFTFNRHTAYFQFDGKIRIGCEYHNLDFWLENADMIGKEHGYSELEIEVYQNFINTCYALQAEVSK